MNIQSGKVRGGQPRTRNTGSSLGARLAIAFRWAVVLGSAGVLANAYIYLNQKIAETGREIRSAQREIHNTEREIDNLIIRRASLSSWPHIRDSIRRFGLKLKPAEPGQVRRLVVIAPGVASHVASATEARYENSRTLSQR